jgi:hypothetical protein
MSGTAVRMDVVATPPLPGERRPPWPVASLEPGEWLVLGGAADARVVGSVVAALHGGEGETAEYGSARDVLASLAGADALRLPGGIRVRDDHGNVVEPGCCCGVEEWPDWLDVGDGETSPWMGHDPWGWVEHQADVLRVCSGPAREDGDGFGPPDAVVVVPRAELPRLLEGVRADLRAFAERLRAWAMEIDPDLAPLLAVRFEAAFVPER